MTTEEKARAYDEAVNKIKPLYEQAKRDGNPIWSTYEYLIPELRESEEQIIEDLRNFIHDFARSVGGIVTIKDNVSREYIKNFLHYYKDYLEKQKEPSWKPSEEQMDALKIAFRKDGDDNYRNAINSLYNDLKKLSL